MCLQLLKSLSSKSIDCLHQCVYSTEIITMSNTGFPHITAIKCGRRFQNDVMHVDRAQLVFAQNFPFKAQEASWIHLVIHRVKWFDTEELPNWTNTSEIHKPMWDKTHANCLVPATCKWAVVTAVKVEWSHTHTHTGCLENTSEIQEEITLKWQTGAGSTTWPHHEFSPAGVAWTRTQMANNWQICVVL